MLLLMLCIIEFKTLYSPCSSEKI